jgi:hypothetical protein
MACANYSCNLEHIRSSPGRSLRAGLRPVASRFVGLLRDAVERFARERLRHAVREIDASVLDKFAAEDPETAREIRDLFGL